MTPKMDEERRFYDKWEMNKIVTKRPIPYVHIPPTNLFSLKSLTYFIEKYRSVFIKPVSLWAGQNVSKVTCKRDALEWKLEAMPPRSYKTIKELFMDLKELYSIENTIIQQEAPLRKYNGRPFDLRIHVQRDLEEGWVVAGDLVRVGGKDSVVSNREVNCGMVQPASKVLASLFQRNAEVIRKRAAVSALAICELLDEHYFFMEVGIDFGLDINGRLWLIEVNTDDLTGGPDRLLFKELPDQTIYNEIMKRHQMNNERTIQRVLEYYENHVKNKKADRAQDSESK